jgi:hypothetical protein
MLDKERDNTVDLTVSPAGQLLLIDTSLSLGRTRGSMEYAM